MKKELEYKFNIGDKVYFSIENCPEAVDNFKKVAEHFEGTPFQIGRRKPMANLDLSKYHPSYTLIIPDLELKELHEIYPLSPDPEAWRECYIPENLLSAVEEYYKDSSGFSTSKKNWDKGLNLL